MRPVLADGIQSSRPPRNTESRIPMVSARLISRYEEPSPDEAGVEQVAVDVVVGQQDVVEQVGVFGPVTGEERIVEELVLELARLGRIPAEDSTDCPRTMKAALARGSIWRWRE